MIWRTDDRHRLVVDHVHGDAMVLPDRVNHRVIEIDVLEPYHPALGVRETLQEQAQEMEILAPVTQLKPPPLRLVHGLRCKCEDVGVGLDVVPDVLTVGYAEKEVSH